MVEDYRPGETIVDPGGALLCHGDELKGKGNSIRRIGALPDQMVGVGLHVDV